jgi:coproporphyrinogen III oxidase-like Fe-S oxidoreductase
MMMGFRLKEGINRKTFRSRFGTSCEEILGRLWPEWSEKSYIEDKSEAIALNCDARLILNALLGELSVRFDSLQSEITPSVIEW